jgi:hypothetical protein
MAYMNPQQYLDAISGIGRGSRYTAFEDPNAADPNDVLKFTGPYQARGGTPNFSGSRAASGTYDPVPIQQASAGTELTSLQKGLEQFNRQQGGSGGDRPQVPPMSEQPSLYPSDIGQAAPGYGYGPSVPQGSDDPQGMMSKIGGFFTRTPGMGQTLSSLGAGIAAESSKPGGSFWTGLASGSDAAMQAEQRRQMIEQQQQAADRTRAQEDEGRAAQKKVNDRIAEITSGWDENTTPEQRVSDLHKAANVAFGNGEAALGRGLLEEARDIGVDPAGGSTTRFTNHSPTEYRAPDGTPTRGRMRTVTQANGEVEQIFEYLDKDILRENLNQGMGAAEAQMAAWQVGGQEVDPAEERRLAEEGAVTSAQERQNNNLRGAANSGKWGMVVDPVTGEPNYLDYKMAGAVVTSYDDAGNPVSWERGGLEHLETWQALLGEWVSNAGSEVVGGPTKFINMVIRSQLPSAIQEGYTEALNFINPTVRFLSGAQMTNQEAMRYYNALIAMPGDTPRNIELKRRKRDVLTNAMGGEGITEAQKRDAREILGIAPDADMSHAFGDFGLIDDTGQYAMDYYLTRLDRHPTLGVSDTFTQDELRQLGRGAGRGATTTPGGILNIDLTDLYALPGSVAVVRP